VAVDEHHKKEKRPIFFKLLGWARWLCTPMCSICYSVTIRAACPPAKWGEGMTRRVSIVSRLNLIAAAAAAVLFCLGADPALAGCSKSVVLYNASWCPYCRQVRAILARNHIKYRILDATTAAVQADMVRRFGDTAIPRTIIGGALVEGVDEDRIKQLCR